MLGGGGKERESVTLMSCVDHAIVMQRLEKRKENLAKNYCHGYMVNHDNTFSLLSAFFPSVCHTVAESTQDIRVVIVMVKGAVALTVT
jgi:hypothetical protein